MLDPLHDPLKDKAIVPQKYVEALKRQGWVKVVHGHFIKTDNFSDEPIDWVRCSVCGSNVPDWDYRFCPHCGSIMDGGDDDG